MSTAVVLLLATTAIPGAFAIQANARPKPRITGAQARRVALRKYPHGRADRKVALENEDGKWQYAVVVHDKTAKGRVMHEVMVGAMSGKIEADEVTSPGEEAKEKAAEQRAVRSGNGRSKTRRGEGK
jgi:hypothetical protein